MLVWIDEFLLLAPWRTEGWGLTFGLVAPTSGGLGSVHWGKVAGDIHVEDILVGGCSPSDCPEDSPRPGVT